MLRDLLIQPSTEVKNFFEERIDLVGATPMLEAANNISFDLLSEKKRAVGTRYDHAVRIFIGLMNAADQPLQEEFLAAALLHDVFDSKDDSVNSDALKTVLSLENGDYVLGILLATEEYEKQAEQWRTTVLESVYSEDPEDKNSKHLESLLSECATAQNPVESLKIELTKCLTSKGADNIDKQISDELWNFRSPLIDINQTVEILDQLDIEALILKCFESIDNLRFPNPRNKIAGFRDAQEMISFYAPLIELCGFKSVATEVYGTALEYLNTKGEMENVSDPKTVSLVKKYHEISRALRNLNVYEEVSDAINIQDLIDSPSEGITIKSRPNNGEKTLGSFLEKCRLVPEDLEIEMCPDFLGFRVCIPRTTLEFDSFETFSDVFRIVTERLENSLPGLVFPGNTRGDIPIEITFGGNKPRTDKVDYADMSIPADVRPTRKSGYNAAHFYYFIEVGGHNIGLEVQVTDDISEEENQSGKAAHIIYKGGKSYGHFGEIKRTFETTDHDDPNYDEIERQYNIEIQTFVASLDSIRKRAEEFKQRENVGLTVFASQLVQNLVMKL